MRFRGALLALTIAAISSPALATSLLSNGSFENGNYNFNSGGGGEDLGPGSTTITDWTVFANDVAAISDMNGFSFTAEDGDVSLDLQSYSDGSPYGGVEQTINTQIGAKYELDFYVGSIGGTTSASATAGGVAIGLGTSTYGGSGDTWTENTFDFTAASSTTNIQLQGVTAENAYIGLDNASVTLISSPVPLPAGIYGGAALIGIVALSRRMRKIARLA